MRTNGFRLAILSINNSTFLMIDLALINQGNITLFLIYTQIEI